MAICSTLSAPERVMSAARRTDAAGKGQQEVVVEWIPRAGEARAIVFHNTKTNPGGVAAAKLACLPIDGL